MDAPSLFRQSLSRTITTASRPRLASSPSHASLICTRHKATAARSRRALRIGQHPSFMAQDVQQDHIIFNAPSSAKTVYHTPFKFLPHSDVRRRNNIAHLFENSATIKYSASPLQANNSSSSSSSDVGAGGDVSAQAAQRLPPLLRQPRNEAEVAAATDPDAPPSTIITKEQVLEMRRLRQEDPHTWDVLRLSKEFGVPQNFVMACTQADKAKKEFEQERLEKAKARWGPIRAKAKEERKRRYDMLMRGEI